MLKAYPFLPADVVDAGDGGGEMDAGIGREVAALFEAENARRGGTMFDGLTFSVERIEEGGIVGRFVRYSRFIAQRARPELFDALRVRPLGVSGLLTCADGIVFGRRDASVTQDAGLWELVPAGGVDPSSRDGTGRIDVVAQILDELTEETGIGRGQVVAASPFVVIEDTDEHVIDMAIAIETALDADAVLRQFSQEGSGEYTDLRIVPVADIPQFVERCGDELAGISRFLLREKGLL